MRRVVVVAVREYRAAVQTRAFVVSLVMMPVLMMGSFWMQKIFEKQVDITDKRFAVLDRTARLYPTLAAAVETRNREEIFESKPGVPPRQIQPRFLVEEVAPVAAAERDQQLLALSDRVRDQQLFGFLEIGDQAFSGGWDVPDAQFRYFSQNATNSDFTDWAYGILNEAVIRERLSASGIEAKKVMAATAPIHMTSLDLVTKSASGQIAPPKEVDRLASFMIPFLMVMLLFMVISVGALPLMSNVLEEKTNRIAEVLLGSIDPFQLMLGKLIGTVGVALTILSLYMIGGIVAARNMGYGDKIPTQLIGWFVVYQSLAVLMFGAMFMAIGAAVSDMKEAQSLLMPVWLIVCLPLFMLMPIIRDPSGSFAVAVSFFPFATPMIMLLRQAIPPGIPLWQPLIGVALCLLTTVLCIWSAGRIFRIGILLHGKAPKPAELIHWIVKG